MNTNTIVPQDTRNEVRDKCGMQASTVLLCALESAVSLTPRCLTKILSVLEGSAVTESAALKMRKALSKNFIARRITTLSSPNPGKSVKLS